MCAAVSRAVVPWVCKRQPLETMEEKLGPLLARRLLGGWLLGWLPLLQKTGGLLLACGLCAGCSPFLRCMHAVSGCVVGVSNAVQPPSIQ